MKNNIKPRPALHTEAAGKIYPGAWKKIDNFRADRGIELPNWPDWCFAPLAAWYAIVCAETERQALDLQIIGDVSRLAALGAWRTTQGIYRFDPALYDAIIATKINGDLPCDVLYRLPEWCVYIETPDLNWFGSLIHGVFVHLEWDANTSRHELRLLIDSESNLIPIPLHIGKWSLHEAINRMKKEASTQSMLRGGAGITIPVDDITDQIEPIISLVLYLCSVNAEIGDGVIKPKNPVAKSTKNGMRIFPVEKPKTWDVGVRIGAALRRAYHQTETEHSLGVESEKNRPHIRRAHWHGFWTGPKNTEAERKLGLKWLPPISINVVDSDNLVPVIRKINQNN